MKKALRILALLAFVLLVNTQVWAQTTLVTYTFDGSGLTGSTNVTSASGVSPTMTASVAASYFQGNPTSGMAASFATSGATKYLELTMTTTGYSNIKVSFDGRSSSAGSIWNVSGDPTGGTTIASTGVSLTCNNGSYASLASTALSATGAYDNKSSVRLRFICGGTSATMRIDNIIITGTAQATGVSFTSTTSSGTNVDWTNGTGAKRAVFMALASTGSAAPVINTTYTANTAYGSGSQIGSTGWYCIFNGTTHASGVTVSNLAGSSTYRVMVCEYDGAAAAEKYNYYDLGTNNPANVTTLSASGPGITGAATTTAFTTTYGTVSAAQTFTVGGTNLTANLIATAPTGFEVSDNGTTYGGTATFAQSSGTASGTLYLRLKADASAGSYNSQNVVLSSTGATSQNITTPASGNVVNTKTLTITGVTASNKVYNQSAAVTVNGTAAYSGLANSESFAVTSSGTFVFPDANVGTNKTLTGLTYNAPSANYTVTQPTVTASITAVNLTTTGAVAQDKPYDATNAATITGTTLVGVLSGDNVTVGGGGTFASVNVGTNIPVTAALTLGGTHGGNYTLTQPTGLTANITAAPVALGNYLFTGTSCASYGATGVPANISFNNIAPTGITCNSNVANAFSGNTTWPGSFSTAKYLEFTITINSGYQLLASSLVMDVWRSSAGATNYAVRSSVDSYAADIATGTASTTPTTKTITLGSPTYEGLTSSITFRIYGWGGTSGDWRLDNITLNGIVDALATPVLNGAATASAFTTTYGTASTAQSFAISGSSLSSSITATAPTGFEVSSDGTTYGATATYPQSGGTATGTVYVRLKANAAVGTSIYNGQNVAISSGVTTINITTAASGNQVSAKALDVTASAQSKTYGTALTLGAGQTTFTSSGIANSETIGSVTLASTGAVATAAPGGYNIVPSLATGGTFTASNYSINYINGTLTVNKATPTITVTGSSSYAITGSAVGPNTYSAPAVGGGAAPSGTVTFSYVGTGGTTYGPSATRPSAIGTYTATASIAADVNYNSATSAAFAFSITGSANSDIVYNSASSASQNQDIDYTAYQAATITNTLANNANGSIGVMGFTLRDGGAATDADNNATTLTDISFSVTNVANIRSAAIFNGNSLIAAVAVNGTSPITFTGLSVVCPDDQTLALNLRVTFNTTVTDKQKMVFTVSSATALSSGSVFAAANAGAAQSDNVTAAVNRIAVSASKLVFVQGPSNTGANAAMSPSVTVKASDANGNTDIDYTGTVTITSTGTLSGTSTNTAALSSGLATFSNIVHSTAGTSLTLTASLSPLTSTGASSTFDITSIVYANNDWRSLTPGTWTSTSGAGTATWERYSGGTWSPATGTSPTGTANVYIAHNIQIPTAGGSYGGASITILPGATLTWGSSSPWTAKNMHIYSTATLQIDTRFTMDAAGTFEVEDAGLVNFNYSGYSTTNLSSSLWNGTEDFHPNSVFTIQDFSSASADLFIPVASDITANAYNGYTACFGNLVFNSGTSGTFTLLSDAFNKNLTHNDLIFKSPSGSSTSTMRMNTTGYTVGIGGNLIMDASLVRSLSCLNVVATATINIKKNLINNSSASFTVLNNTGSSSVTINIDSNLTVPNSGTVNMNGASGTSTATSVINVKGDVAFGTGATLTSTATSNSAVNFSGTGDGLTAATTQTVDIASTAATRNQYVDFTVKSGAYVQLLNSNLDLGKNSSVTVANGGTLDFSFNGTTALNLTSYSTGTNFTSATGSTLKITSPNGCNNTSGTVGNVQTTNAPTYNQTATFWFMGKANQITGTIFGAGGSADRIIYVKLLDNTITLSPVVPVTIGGGGKVEVQKGIVVNTPAADFIGGTGKLIMSDGVYQNSETASIVPILGGSSTSNYTLTGGTVELNAAADQVLRGGVDYYNLTFSNSGTKTLSSALPANSLNELVTIKDAAILDVENKEFSGDAGLTMLNTSRFRLSMLNTTLPQLTGINAPYILTGGTVELYGSSSVQTHTLKGTYGSPSTTITYNNVELNATGANIAAGGANVLASAGFNVNGVMNVNSPACFQLASTHTIAGTGSFNVLAGATFKYGGTIAATGATGNIQTASRNFAATASYGFVGSVNQTAGTGLPAQMVNMYLDKTAASNTVTLSQSTTVNNSLVFYKGILVTGTSKVSVAAAATVSGASAANGWVNGNLEKFIAASTAAKSFEIGDAASYTSADLIFAGTTNGTGSLTAFTVGADHPQIASSSINASKSVNRYWSIVNSGVTGFTSYDGTFNFVTSDIDAGSVGNTASFAIAKYINPTWASGTVGTRTPTSTQITGATTFGEYQIGETVSGYVWTGASTVDNNWTTATNWNIGVPVNGCATNVVIPSGTPRNPVLTGAVSVGDITLGDSKTLDLGSNNITACGNWTGGSTTASSVIGAGKVILTGATAQTLSGRTAFTTLHLAKTTGTTATMQSGSAFDINTAVELESGTLATGSGTLTFKSTSTTQIAVLDNFTSGYTGTITGNITAERYYSTTGVTNQHYMGSPVSTTLAQFGAGSSSGFVTPKPTCDETALASTSVYGSVFSYDQSNGSSCSLAGWKVEAGSTAATAAKGFSVTKTGSNVLSVSGAPNTAASYGQSGTNAGWTNSSLQGRPMTAGWVLVSNPYLAYLDFTTQGAPTNFTSEVKVWRTTGAFAGSYQDLQPGEMIAPFQGFFVHSTATGSYPINGNKRTRSTAGTFQAQANDQQLSILATNNNTTLADITMVAFNSDATTGFDNDYDAQKIAGTLGRHTLYTVGANNLWMSKNIHKSIAETSTITMGFEPEVAGTYTFSFDGLNSFDPTSYIMLEDRKLGTMYNVRNGDYQFTADSADQWERFVLHFTPAAEVTATDENCNSLGNINVTQPGTANWTYTLTDANNATVATGTLNETTQISTAVATGTYTLTLVDNSSYTVAKTVTVNGAGAVAAVFTPSVNATQTNMPVNFTSSSVATSYYWDFGDGTTESGQNVIHSYADTGTYTVTLIVISEGGCSTSSSQTVTVSQTATGIGTIANGGPISIWSNGGRVYVDLSRQSKVEAEIQIYNVIGQELVNEKFGRSTIYSKPMANIEVGYVIVKVKNAGSFTTKKVLITNN